MLPTKDLFLNYLKHENFRKGMEEGRGGDRGDRVPVPRAKG